MSTSQFETIKADVFKKLEGLNSDLTYHSAGHTKDVLRQAIRIAEEESVTDEKELFILKVAALYHDTGFLETYANHEVRSCEIFLKDAARYGFNGRDCDLVTQLIMVTKIPQQPKTLLERILCDADLDYLGRDDFEEIGDKLRREFLVFGIVSNDSEWDRLQLKFLGNHQYHTASSRRDREPVKQHNLSALVR